MEAYVLGFDPETLAERVDVPAARRRLDELAEVRSIDALTEKIGLLRVSGWAEEARDVATEAMREARLAGDRETIARVKVARAGLLCGEGRHDQAIQELSDAFAEASANGWTGLDTDALRQRALVRAALGEFAAARDDLGEALAILIKRRATPREIDDAMIAVGALLDRVGG